ncbi:hypothetical protein VF14_03635 [Nostoc linckia z18]|jgi:hypothetical protein|uniref:Uncharacterized protein n=2 Tax=Nostoc linckia TaxID=92942 RepID=A0A9Q5ZGJ6_NOSLI|nr:hypothetical protein [Nostoc linckia]PHK41466.1 hypothetical protein VF12_06620 [Nostoc linckia z15]PHK46967.1 hypothetical protein VF13_08280 [Nostoc linckia z16]PHJ69228.1 hypothetical protein VF02_01105 [Nostoc linckia z1]PHJ73380.1 hypothetical protein VF05_02125 [Nostoc linckia z3]PHJ78727.1 hypothetical protein VF03_01110 [Nostoc linckia z2]
MQEIEALKQATLLNRAAFFNKISDTQKQSDRAQEQQVQIISYDTGTRTYKVKHPNGSQGFAKAISNSSNLCKGAYVSLVQPKGTTTATIDTVPKG